MLQHGHDGDLVGSQPDAACGLAAGAHPREAGRPVVDLERRGALQGPDERPHPDRPGFTDRVQHPDRVGRPPRTLPHVGPQQRAVGPERQRHRASGCHLQAQARQLRVRLLGQLGHPPVLALYRLERRRHRMTLGHQEALARVRGQREARPQRRLGAVPVPRDQQGGCPWRGTPRRRDPAGRRGTDRGRRSLARVHRRPRPSTPAATGRASAGQ